MYSISDDQIKIIKKGIFRIAKNYKIAGACLYGSKSAGYAEPASDFDIILVLENYAYVVKYVYIKESNINISVLVVNRESLEKDARTAFLGEFVVGRLLHIYESIYNPEFFKQIEIIYKKRVILEEISDFVKSTNILTTEISFPLEFIMFSKIKHRSILYPNAVYSYYRMYTGKNAARNTDFAIEGYKQALKEILSEDKELLIERSDNMIQISEKCIIIQKRDKAASLKLTKKLQVFSSYLVHTYAGRRIFHYAVGEAEAKIKRHIKYSIELPKFMSCPKNEYWKLSEGVFIFDTKYWLDQFAISAGFSRYSISTKNRLGNVNSRTFCYTLTDLDGQSHDKIIVVRKFTKSKSVKWAAFNVWAAAIKHFKMDPLFRLGTEYKAIRHLRYLGLHTPVIESVVLNKRLLITEFIEGNTLADTIRNSLRDDVFDHLKWIRIVGEHIANVHANKSTFGNVKPKNIIISKSKNYVYFTDLEQFSFRFGDPIWDLVHFISFALRGIRKADIARQIIGEFLHGYSKEVNSIEYMKKLAKSKRYIELFYPMLFPSIVQAIKNEIKSFLI
jgi:tRNA A-37 threonylcarbamoyl transferase component Bud32/predicted nucleotidyltransferase